MCPCHVVPHEPLSLQSPRPARLPGGPRVCHRSRRLAPSSACGFRVLPSGSGELPWPAVTPSELLGVMLGPRSGPLCSSPGPSTRCPLWFQRAGPPPQSPSWLPMAMDPHPRVPPGSPWTLTFLPPGELLRDSTLLFSFLTKCFGCIHRILEY